MPGPGPRLLPGPRLKLAASLRQGLALLLLDRDELREAVNAALAENPFLDVADGAEGAPPDAPGPAEDREGGLDEILAADPGTLAPEDDPGRPTETAGPEPPAPEAPLHTHLADQIAGLHMSARDRALALHLLDRLDERGYLGDPPEELRAAFPCRPPPEPEELEAVRHRLQGLDPVGCFSLDLGDCLRAQARRDPELAEGERHLLLALLDLPLADLARRSDAELAARLGRTAAEIGRARRRLRRLDPAPGRRRGGPPAIRLLPDLVFEAAPEGWRVRLFDDGLPPLVLRRLARGSAGARADWARCRDEARGFLRALALRRRALLALGEAVLRHQEAFFREGTRALVPLRQRTLAAELGVHESTLSRLVQGKHLLSPQGLHPLKFFFPPPAAAARAGGGHSPAAVLAALGDILADEPPERPYRDGELVELLARRGIMVARRTVSKYRELRGIPPWHERRGRPAPPEGDPPS